MASNSSINLVDLDFDLFKSSLVTHMKSQDQFKDYNFEGSAINVLLDVLSYNTFKNAFYLNMVHSEGFLDSAQMRESVFSHAKELNYLPRSTKSSTAIVTVTFTANKENQPYVIRKGETFSAIVNQESYTFSVDSDQILTSQNTTFTSTFEIYEGSYTAETFVIDSTDVLQRFKISNKNIDVDSLSVLVYENGAQNPVTYKKATTLLDLNQYSEVFFVQPSSAAGYEILFGDGVVGKRPVSGSIVVADYRVSAGAASNGAKNFTVNFDPTNGNLLSEIVTTVNEYTPNSDSTYSVNGADAESIESVKFYAPRHFQTQERAVTASDYEILLKMQYPEINAVSVYGGEEVSPPRYGKVFVAIDIKDVDGIPESKKREYYSFLKSRSPLSIDPIFTNPEFTYVRVNSKVKYNINKTTRSNENLQTAVVLTIDNYGQTYLNNFNSKLRYSKLIQAIDGVDTSIVSNETDLALYKKLNPKENVAYNYILQFNVPLQQTDYVSSSSNAGAASHLVRATRTVTSSTFIFNGATCIMEDDGAGKIRIVKNVGNYHYSVKTVGTVDYTTGKIVLNNFNISSYDGSSLRIYVRPSEKDIIGSTNVITGIESGEINVTVEAIRE